MRKLIVAIVFVVSLASLSFGDEPEKRDANAGLAKLQDGTETAEEALHAFVAASRMGDVDACLLLVDPPIRRLLGPEVAIDAYFSDSILVQLFELKSEMSKAMIGRGAIPVAFAERDLTGEREIKVLSKRPIDDDRIVFEVEGVKMSYHSDGTDTVRQEYLTVRREGRWHLFRPFGMMLVTLRSEYEQQPDMREGQCEDFLTDDEKPILGAYSVLSNVAGVD